MKNTWRTISYRRRTRPYPTKDYRVSSQESGRRHPGREEQRREEKRRMELCRLPLHPLPHAKRRPPIPSILSCPIVRLKSSEVNLKKLVAKCYSPSEESDRITGPANSSSNSSFPPQNLGRREKPTFSSSLVWTQESRLCFYQSSKTIGFRQPIGGAARQGSKIGVQPKTYLSRGNRGIRSYDREV